VFSDSENMGFKCIFKGFDSVEPQQRAQCSQPAASSSIHELEPLGYTGLAAATVSNAILHKLPVAQRAFLAAGPTGTIAKLEFLFGVGS
jgi:hypothetical protein